MAIKFTPPASMSVTNITEIPHSISLSSVYPNPFNPSITMDFTIEKFGHISIDIYNIRGEKVKALDSRIYSPGSYSLQWDGTGNNGSKLPSGLYFVSVRSKEEIMSQKIMLLK